MECVVGLTSGQGESKQLHYGNSEWFIEKFR